MKEPQMKACPSYIGCRAPICPLESIYPSTERFCLPGEARCVANKRTRFKLGKGLKFHGLFAREYQGMAKMGSLERFEASCLGLHGRIASPEASDEAVKPSNEVV